MTSVFGVELQEVSRRIGLLDQVAAIDRLVDDDGPGRGARRWRLSNGSGLEVEVMPDRGLDLGRATFCGIPLAWCSSTGFAAPSLVENSGTSWLRTFGGGLLTTCGLDTFGPPSTVEGREFPLHGRVNAIPTQILRSEIDGRDLTVEAELHQAEALGEHLMLRRRIQMPLGEAKIRISDRVKNCGIRDAGHMLLYHINLGWPLIDNGVTLAVPNSKVSPRDSQSASAMEDWETLTAPERDFEEQVLRHEMKTETGVARVVNSRLGITFELKWPTGLLGSLFQWRMLGDGNYVLGLEPANSSTLFGRRTALESGQLRMLAAGTSVDYQIELSLEGVLGVTSLANLVSHI